ncbi:MAG: hypothetical protein M3Q00_01015 [Pseudomonadota bacterium]|nr:hypothetical protein [Pseudomonadota bacterium]
MKEELALLGRLEADCHSIQRSLAIIRSAQRIVTFYTCDERQLLFKEYSMLTSFRGNSRNSETNSNDSLAVFRQDHPDLALIADVLAQDESINLNGLKLNL